MTKAAWLAAPLLAFTLIAFLLPLALTLRISIQDPELPDALPHTAALLRAWDGPALPDDSVMATLTTELADASRVQKLGALARRLDLERPGLRATILRTARAGPLLPQQLRMFDPAWSDPATWRLLRNASLGWTPLYLLRALDLERTPSGGIRSVEPDRAVFRTVFLRTAGIASLCTGLAVLIAYPVAASLVALRGALGQLGLALVLMPFWISILVRTAAWFILLQRQGPVNAALLTLGLIDHPVQLLFTRFAVIVAITHVMLPYAVLPLFAAMRRIDPALLRAASGLGARPWQMVWRVHIPLAMPGVLAGGAIVFLLAVGFWVTPALIGSPTDQLVGSFVAASVNETLNWGLAAALSLLLLAGTTICLGAAWLPLRRLSGR